MTEKEKPPRAAGVSRNSSEASLPCRVLLVNSPDLAQRLSDNLHDTRALFANPERMGNSIYCKEIAGQCGDGVMVFATLDMIETYKGDSFSGLQGLLGARLVSIPMTVADIEKNPAGLQIILEAKDSQVEADDAKFNRRLQEMQAAEADLLVSEKKPKRNGKTNDDEKPGQVSFQVDGNFLYEEVILGGHLTFLRYNAASGGVEEADEIKLEDGSKIIPQLPSDEHELQAVLLPTGAIEYTDTKSLLADIQSHIHKYVDVSLNFLKFASYYVLLTYLYDKMNTLPYLRALGDTGCGKSRLIDTVGRLCYKSTVVSGSVTPAAIYRMIRRWGGTVVLDEADMKNSDEYNEVITILNCGFERGRPVIRATKDNPDKLQFLPTFCPKVFGTRRRFQDAALEARCLTEIMQETDRTDIPVCLGYGFFQEQAELRNKLLMFRFRNWHATDAEQAGALDLGSDIEPRLRQVSSAFGAVFAGMDDVLEDYKAFIHGLQRELIEQRASTPVGQVVETLFELSPGTIGANGANGTFQTVTGEKLLPVQSKDIAEKTGKTAQAVGQTLKGLGLRTRQDRINGQKGRWIIYNETVLGKLHRRYILPDDSAPSVPFVPSVTGDSEESEQPELAI